MTPTHTRPRDTIQRDRARIGSTPNSIAEVHSVPLGAAMEYPEGIAAAPDLLNELSRSATFLEAAADCCLACGKVEQAEVLLGQSARARAAIAMAKWVAK